MSATPFVGAGVGYRRAHRKALLDAARDGRPKPRVLEVVPDHFFADPAGIEALAASYPLVFHDVGLSVATSGDGPKARLERIRRLVRVARPFLFSDHLAMVRGPGGVDLGHLGPVWYTHEVLAMVIGKVRALQDVLQVPVALENIAAPFVVPGADMSEPEFFTRLVEATGCGMLLDVTNVLMNARNFGLDAAARISEYPLEAVQQVHLAGGFLDRSRFWVDSHSEPVEDESYRLLGGLTRAKGSLRTIIVERDDKLPELDMLMNEAARAEQVWEGIQ